MRRTRWIGRLASLVAVLFALGGLPGLAPTAQATPGLSPAQTFAHGGLNRTYYIYEPTGLPSPARVVFALHGGGQEAYKAATQQDLNGAAFRWRYLADTHKFIVVYPQASNGSNGSPNWNDCRGDASILPNTVDDVGFIDTILTRLTTVHGYSVDSQSVYVVGASNGGLMAQRLALQLSNKIAAVGAVAANAPQVPKAACPSAPANAISIAFMNGNGDKMMPWGGGCVNNASSCSENGTVKSSDATVVQWRGYFGANTAGAVVPYVDNPTADKSRAEYQLYTGGSQGTRVGYWRVLKNAGCGTLCKGAGHATPAKDCCWITGGVELIVGKQNHDFNGIDALWDFVSAHTLTT